MPETPVVLLIHGIRTAAWWQSRIAWVIEQQTAATVIPIKYGYFDILRFWCPLGLCRSGPIEKLRQQIEGVANTYKDRPLIIFAHSYGTYALTRVIDQNPFFRFDRVILCGSIVPSTYDWRKVHDQIKGDEKRDAVVNECGTRDIWPVLAQSITWGYGATGTYGFGTFNVRDRFHNLAHSEFFSNEFVEKHWIPLVQGDKVTFSKQDIAGTGSPAWFTLVRFLPIKLATLIVLTLGAAAYAMSALGLGEATAACKAREQQVESSCFNTSDYGTPAELREHINDTIKQGNRVLDMKQSELFPLLRSYIDAPTTEKWTDIMAVTNMLLGAIKDGLTEIDRNASFKEVGGRVYYLTKNDHFVVDRQVLNDFDQARELFGDRMIIIKEMEGAGSMPNVERVSAWKAQLQSLHVKLDGVLEELLLILDPQPPS
ncbi:MAG: hypothetical protein LCH86_04460 [Proteobacteria bacterium]|nr:hypothetical protein [Pseudomonadota bacterium]